MCDGNSALADSSAVDDFNGIYYATLHQDGRWDNKVLLSVNLATGATNYSIIKSGSGLAYTAWASGIGCYTGINSRRQIMCITSNGMDSIVLVAEDVIDGELVAGGLTYSPHGPTQGGSVIVTTMKENGALYCITTYDHILAIVMCHSICCWYSYRLIRCCSCVGIGLH